MTEDKVLATIGQSYSEGLLMQANISKASIVLTPERIYGVGKCLQGKKWVTQSFNGEIVNLSSIGMNQTTDTGIRFFAILAFMGGLGLLGGAGGGVAGSVFESLEMAACGICCFGVGYWLWKKARVRVLAINMQGTAYPLKMNGIKNEEVTKFVSLAQDTASAARKAEHNQPRQQVIVQNGGDPATQKLQQLKNLHDNGVLSDAEYQEKRKALLASL